MINTDRVKATAGSNALAGKVVWCPGKSIWFISHFLIALFFAPLLVSVSSVGVFIALTGTTLCFGHSLGMQRLLIHRSYECSKWMEYLFVYLGTLVGMSWPIGMIKQHDLRDWAQRQTRCHDYLMHGSGIIRDGWWQLNCELSLENGPGFTVEERRSIR